MLRALTLLCALALASSGVAQDIFDMTKIRDFHFTFPQTNFWNLLVQSQSTGLDVKGDLTVDGLTYKDVGMRVKGASSSTFPGNKKPFNLTMDSFVLGQDLYGATTLNLNNGAMDPTLTRETICYQMFRDYLPAPRTAYVRIHLNGQYWGIYNLIEQPNKAMLRSWFRDEDGTRYKGDRPSGAAVGTSGLTWRGSGTSNYTGRYEIKTATHANAWTDLVHMIDRLNNTSAGIRKAEIEKVVNVDRAIWYFVMMNLVVNSDDYMGAAHNYYMYFDPDDGRMNMIPWDLNEAFGTHGPRTNPWNYAHDYHFTSSSYPLVQRIMSIPEWRELYYAHYRTAIAEWWDWTNIMEPLNTRYMNMIRPDVQSDPNYLYTMNQFTASHGRYFSQFHYLHGMKEVVQGRENYLRGISHLTKAEPQLSQVTLLTANPAPRQAVWVTATVTGTPAIAKVELRSTRRGIFTAYQMFDDGQHQDGAAGDGVFGGSFPAGPALSTMRYFVHATDTLGTVQVAPKRAAMICYEVDVAGGPPIGKIILNEFLADNDTGAVDEQNEYEDWIELHNTGTSNFDVAGYYLSDDPEAPKKWQIPANTVIPAGGFIRVWADDEPGDGKLHATFKLSKAGEVVALYDTDANQNRLLDGVRYGQQKGDRAFGRVPDAGKNWFFVYNPTSGTQLLQPGDFTRYDGRRGGSPTDFVLDGSGLAQTSQTFSFDLSGGVPNSSAAFILSAFPARLEIPVYGILGVDHIASAVVGVVLDGTGAASLPVPVPATAAGARVYGQAVNADLSNALTLRVQ